MCRGKYLLRKIVLNREEVHIIMKRGLWIFLVLCLGILSAGFVFGEENDTDLYADIDDATLTQDAGLTPDNFLYFIDDFVERISIGESAEKALAYKEEKIAEAQKMIEKGNIDAAKSALEKAQKYGVVVEQELSPDMEKEIRRSSKAVKDVLSTVEGSLEGEEWNDVREQIIQHDQKEDEIAVAAKVSGQ